MVSGIMWYRYLKKNNDRREALESKGAFDVRMKPGAQGAELVFRF